jgi:hypothetical protein
LQLSCLPHLCHLHRRLCRRPRNQPFHPLNCRLRLRLRLRLCWIPSIPLPQSPKYLRDERLARPPCHQPSRSLLYQHRHPPRHPKRCALGRPSQRRRQHRRRRPLR